MSEPDRPDPARAVTVIEPVAMAATVTAPAERPARRREGGVEVSIDGPDQIGRFAILGKLGEGGMGAVYEGYDADLDRRVAIKVISLGRGSAAARARLLREAQAMARVAHPNVVSVYEVGLFERDMFIAMELVEGRTLSAWLAEDEHDWRAILEKFLGAARGLAAAHAADVVHRDFKPDNVLVDFEGRVRVLDFGLARGRGDRVDDGGVAAGSGDTSASSPPAARRGPRGRSPGARSPGSGPSALELELTQEGTIMGTPSFMSPEHFRGRAVDPLSDQFCFGVAMYRALYRQAPFDGDTVDELREAVLTSAIRPAPTPAPTGEVPPTIQRAVARALAGEPAARHPSMDALADAIHAALTIAPDADPSVSRDFRRLHAAATMGVSVVMVSIVTLVFGTELTARRVAEHAAFGTLVAGLAAFSGRKHLFRNAYNRHFFAIFALPIVATLLHRLAALAVDASPRATLIGDALLHAVAMAAGAMLLERWLLWNVALALAYVGAALAFGDRVLVGFPVMILASIAVAIRFWREDPKQG